MGLIKINNEIYGTSNASDIVYKDITVEEKLDTIPIFDINDNGYVDNSGSDYLTYGHIIDNLTSNITDKVLSANQGKVLNESINSLTNNLINLIYPVGSIYMSVNNVSPASFLGGTWEAIRDRFLLAAGSSYSAGSTGGAATVTLTENEIPSHEGHLTANNTNTGGNTARYLNQTVLTTYGSTGRGWSVQSSNEIVPAGHSKGGSQAHNNMPPYLTVYIWKRIS